MELTKNRSYEVSQDLTEEKCLSDFCRARGARFFVVQDSFWMSRGLRFFSPWPSSKPISLSSDDLRFMWSQNALFLHYVSDEDKPFYPGYDLVVDKKNYDFGSITSGKRRHNIRWALKHCLVERVSFDVLVRDAGALIEDTHRRQSRIFNHSVLEMWKNYFRLAESNPLFESWASFVSNQLAAVCVLITVGGGVYIEMTFSRTGLLKYHPVDALAFVVTQQAILKDHITFVSYGKRPIIGETDSLVSFKESMGFKKIPVKERIEVHPVLKPLLFQPLNSLARFVAKSASNRSMYARIIAGVLDTYHGQLQRHEFGQQE